MMKLCYILLTYEGPKSFAVNSLYFFLFLSLHVCHLIREVGEFFHIIYLRPGELAGAINPNIEDLSDINRPTKISEQYSELYDNEWTDAFSYLTEQEGLDEKRAIQILLIVLQVSRL